MYAIPRDLYRCCISVLTVIFFATVTCYSSSVWSQTVQGPVVDWNISFWGKKRAMSAGMEHVAEQIAKRTDNKFRIKIHYGEALSKSRENLDGISLGALQGAFFCNFYHPGKNPAWMILTLPFLPIDNPDISQRVREMLLDHPAFLADMERWNAIPYISSLLPTYQFMGRGAPPLSLEEWKGLRVRAGGGIGEAMKKLGATPTTIPSPEIYTSIERGTIDAASLPFTYGFKSFNVNEVSDWYTVNLSPGTAECAVVFNKDSYEALPPQYQALLNDLKREAYTIQRATYKNVDAKNLPLFEKDLTGIVYTDAQIAQFRDIAGQPIWEEWVIENNSFFDARSLLNDLLATAEEGN